MKSKAIGKAAPDQPLKGFWIKTNAGRPFGEVEAHVILTPAQVRQVRGLIVQTRRPYLRVMAHRPGAVQIPVYIGEGEISEIRTSERVATIADTSVVNILDSASSLVQKGPNRPRGGEAGMVVVPPLTGPSGNLPGFEQLVHSETALRFIAAVLRRRELSWLPEGRAESVKAALFEGLRQAAVINDWPEEPSSILKSWQKPKISTDVQNLLGVFRWAVETAQSDPKLMTHISGEPKKLEKGMSVYASRADLSRDPTPW